MKKIKYIICIFVVFFVLLSTYVFYIEPHRFVVHKQDITLKKNSTSSLRILQLSDIEISKSYSEGNLKKQVKTINDSKPDIIVFTGDLFNNYAKYGPYQEVLTILSSLKATYGKFAIYGNKDYGGGAVRIYDQLMSDSGFTLLRNEVYSMSIRGKRIQLIGSDSYLMGNFDESSIKQQLTPSDVTILLAHEPEIIDKVTFSYDLMLCGHTHGGQVNIPLLQSLFHISNTPYQKGLYEHDSTFIYVDSGMGTSRIPIRFLTPPQISDLTLYI